MATKHMFVAICLMAAAILTEARSAKQEKASNPDVDLTTVRSFYVIPYHKIYERRKCCGGKDAGILNLGTR
jgi:hypothetical protein